MNLNAIHETIIMLHKAKMKQKEIANKLKVGQSTVSRIIQRYKAGADISDQRKFRNGKQLQVSIRCLNHIRIASARNPTATAQEIRAIVGGKCLLLSKRTIQRYLKRVGCLPYRPSKSPQLTGKQRRCRKRWALDHQSFNFADAIFSDETYISLDGNSKYPVVRRKKGEKIGMVHTRPHRPFQKKLLIWGAIDKNGCGPIQIIRGSIDSQKYKDILERHIIPYQQLIKCFQHDNAPPHVALSVKQLLQSNQINVMEWPPYSPDMNPIENIWAILKRKVEQRHPTNLEKLEESILDIWRNDSSISDASRNAVNSMQYRLKALIKSGGGFTKY